MNKDVAIIVSDKENNLYSKKLCGLYNLERNILILEKVGFKKIILDLSETEQIFYEKKVKKHLKKIKNCEITIKESIQNKKKILTIQSNLFLQAHYFDNEDRFFNKSNPTINENQFLIYNKQDLKKELFNNIQSCNWCFSFCLFMANSR